MRAKEGQDLDLTGPVICQSSSSFFSTSLFTTFIWGILGLPRKEKMANRRETWRDMGWVKAGGPPARVLLASQVGHSAYAQYEKCG